MKYLILPIEEAEAINNAKAISRGASWEGAKYWSWTDSIYGISQALHIPDNELTDSMSVVDELPQEFVYDDLSIQSVDIQKLYFNTTEERDAFNAAEAEYAEADPSVPYLQAGQDNIGYYLLVDVLAKPSLWQRFKNLFSF